jgi:hypothetical protein
MNIQKLISFVKHIHHCIFYYGEMNEICMWIFMLELIKNKNCELVANIKVSLYFYTFEDFT